MKIMFLTIIAVIVGIFLYKTIRFILNVLAKFFPKRFGILSNKNELIYIYLLQQNKDNKKIKNLIKNGFSTQQMLIIEMILSIITVITFILLECVKIYYIGYLELTAGFTMIIMTFFYSSSSRIKTKKLFTEKISKQEGTIK